MAFEFKLPDIGEGVAEGEIVKWLVNEGDAVTQDQALVEIMTDKATVEIPSPHSGKIAQRMGNEGDVIPVGATLVVIDESGSKSSSAPASAATASPAPGAPTGDTPLFSASPAPASQMMAGSAPASQAAATDSSGRVLASPATRKLARDMGVNLSSVPATGPSGRVTKEDVISYGEGATRAGAPQLAQATSAAPRPSMPTQPRIATAPSGGEERVPIRGIRKKIAENMALSKRTAAHFTHIDEVDMTEIVDLRSKTKSTAEARGVKLTYLPFLIRAVATALREFPMLNSSLDDNTNEIVVKHYYNIGVAVATADGNLLVPVVKNADQKSILQIAAEIQELAEKGRNGKLGINELKGGTFTITSIGNIGGLLATPIINYPEVAIMGFHSIKKKPVVKTIDGKDEIVIRQVGNLSLSLDHRVVDGAMGAMFMNAVMRYLEDPKLLLLDA